MNRYVIRTPEGTRDTLFEECAAIRRLQNRLMQDLRRRGYQEAMSPSLEYYDVFERAGGALEQESMFKLTDRNGRLVVLRPDLTTPMARIAASKVPEQLFPLRLSYCQKVFRAVALNSGKPAEVLQVGAELMGAQGLMADLDALSTALEAIHHCRPRLFRLEIGHAGIFKRLIRSLELEEEKAEEIRRLIESKSFAALDDAIEPYASHPAYRALKAMPLLFGGAEVLEEARALTDDEEVLAAVGYLEKLLEVLKQAGLADQVMLDLGLVHEIDYYTGIMFNGYAEGVGSAVLSGGRYDGLCARFGKDLPAVGFAIDVEALSQAMPQAPLPKVTQLVFADCACFQQALDYLQDNPGALLAPCDTLEQARAMARTRGVKTLLSFTLDGQQQWEV